MFTPTSRELDELVYGPDAPALLRLWLKPVEPLLPVLAETRDKPVGQFTVPELMAWGLTVGYIASSMALAELLALNLLRVAVRGR